MRPVTVKYRALALCAMATLLATAALASRLTAPVRVRIVGYVGSIPEGVKHDYKWRIMYQGREYLLYVAKLDVINANMLPNDIDQAVKPAFSKFDLYGDPKAVSDFIGLPPGQQAIISAFVSLGDPGPALSVDSVQPLPGPTAAPGATPPGA
ncbi:MAG: hypothetical protein AB7V27_09840 [Candidatus Binatia bacterium]